MREGTIRSARPSVRESSMGSPSVAEHSRIYSQAGGQPSQLEETAKQRRDVYERENGVVHLVSTGTSTRDSFLLASSESGYGVFFATARSLVPGSNPVPEGAAPCQPTKATVKAVRCRSGSVKRRGTCVEARPEKVGRRSR